MSILRHTSVIAVALCAVACGSKSSSTDTAHVTATVDPQLRNLVNARVVAVGGGGRVFSSAILATGRFSIAVPTGTRYRLVVANTTGSGELRMIGHIAITPKRGAVSLGTLRPVGTANAAPNGGLRTMSESEADDGAEGADAEDDGAENEGDGKRLCDSGDDVELEAENGADADASGAGGGGGAPSDCKSPDADHDGKDDD